MGLLRAMILWLTGKSGISPGVRSLVCLALKPQGINSTDIVFKSLHSAVPSLGEYPKKGKSALPKDVYINAAEHALAQDIKILGSSLKVIVCNDEPTLRALTRQIYTLPQVRGSVYEFKGIPVIVFDNFRLMHSQPHGKFIFGLDLKKLVRYAKGQQQSEPSFNYSLVKSVADVRVHCQRGRQATLIGEDIETRNGIIASIAFTYDYNGTVHTFTVPFIDPFKEDGAYWSEADDIAVRTEIRALNACGVPKVFQNGMYDCAYLIEEGMPPSNYIYDTQNMMHAVWCEAPKRLHNIASYFVDCYRYWKDEAKGAKEDGFGRSRDDLLRFWRYNGLDTYYTWLGCFYLVAIIVRLPWAMRNYSSTIGLANGPCLAASLRGLKGHADRHQRLMSRKSQEADAGRRDLEELTGELGFNPKSPDDVAWFLYDILGAKQTRLQTGKRAKYGPRSTDENVLKLIKEQNNVIINNFIDRLIEAREPRGVLSKYGNTGRLWRRGRFLSWLGTTGTTTLRFNSTKSQFWCGTNAQNLEEELKMFYVADPDYCFVEIDYSASDDRFIAYESQDPDKMQTVEDKTKDIHCKHASFFFGKDYNDFYKAYKAKEQWVVHSTKGLRQIAKKITHGRNYLEGASTMYNVMGRDMAVQAAIFAGHPNALKYTDKELIGVLAELIDKYDHPHKGIYKRLRAWQIEEIKKALKNDKIATFAYGFTRKFFGDLASDHKAQRELISCYGQSGTVGNINRALHKVWYSGLDDGIRCIFLLQGHDSLLLALRRDCFSSYIPRIVAIMEEPTKIHGRDFRVPATPKIGLTWGDALVMPDKSVVSCMREWKPEMTWENLVEHEAMFHAKFNEKFPLDDNMREIRAIFGDEDEPLEDDGIPEPLGQEFDEATADVPELVGA